MNETHKVVAAALLRTGPLLWAALVLGGCSPPPAADLGPAEEPLPQVTLNEAEKLLAAMFERYAKAQRYADDGVLIIHKKTADNFEPAGEIPFRLIFERPNKIELYCYTGHLVSDGATLWGWSDELPGFHVRRAASPTYDFAALNRDPSLQGVVVHGMAGESLPLAMLLGSPDAMNLVRDGHLDNTAGQAPDSSTATPQPAASGTAEIAPQSIVEFNKGDRPELIADEILDGRTYRRISVRNSEGGRQYWIDAETLILRRIEFSVRKIPVPDAATGETDIGLTVEFLRASFDPRIAADAFSYSPPQGTNIVETLPSLAEPPQAAAKSVPKTLKLTQVWQSNEMEQPGFVIAVPGEANNSRVVVCDGPAEITELDARGKVLRKQKLGLPQQPEAVVDTLRTATDGAGQRFFVGFGSSKQQLHVFDADFKRLGSFPSAIHPGISDVQLADLDGDGKPELCVGYWDDVGVQALDLEGRRLWSTRENRVPLPEHILRIAATGADESGKRLLLCAAADGSVAVLDDRGQLLGRPFRVGGLPTRHVSAIDLTGDGVAELSSLTTIRPADTAAGFSGFGNPSWTYPLPIGIQSSPTMANEMVVGGPVLDGEPGAWVFAAPDGTIHLIAADGKPIDSFACGEHLRGLALGAIDGRATLFISDRKTVTALQFAR